MMRIHHRNRFFIVFWAVLLGVALSSEARAGDVRLISLEEALSIAEAHNQDIIKAREQIQWAQGRYVEERSAALPQLTVTGTAQRLAEDIRKEHETSLPTRQNRYEANLNLTQPLFTWGQATAAIRAAQSGMLSADERVRLACQTAKRDVSEAFYDVILAKDLHRISLEDLEHKQRRLDEAKRRYALGTATDYDVLAARVDVENASPEAIRSENQVRVARDRLRFLLGLDGEDIDVKGGLEAAVQQYTTYEETFTAALSHRPELADLRHRKDMSRENVTIARAQDKPRLDLVGDYGRLRTDTQERSLTDSHVSKDRIDTHATSWSVGLQVTWPLFDGLRTKGKVAQAKSELRSVEIEEAQQTQMVALQAREAVTAVREAGEVVKALSGTAVQAERLLAMAEKGYDLGVKIRLEVEDAQLNLNRAKANLSRARRDYLVSRVNLRWTMGVLGEEMP